MLKPTFSVGDIVKLPRVTMRVFGLYYDGACDWWLVKGEPLSLGSSFADRNPIVEMVVPRIMTEVDQISGFNP